MFYINNNPYFKDTVKKTLEQKGFKEMEDEDIGRNLYYCDISYTNRNNNEYKSCQILNQLEDVDILGNKKHQYDKMLEHYKKRPDYIPLTISFDRENYNSLYKYFNQTPREGYKVWIVKPENSFARGGVGIVRNFQELHAHLSQYPKFNEWIMQEFIDEPLLINNKKFHFRVYAILVQNQDWQAIYLGRKGFMYTALREFEKGNYLKEVALSGEDSPNNVLYFPEDFWKEHGKQMWDKKIYPQFLKIVRETIKPTFNYLKCPNQNKCFKILGYDILIDKDYNCHLAEINARNVSYKYPNEEFSKTFYNNILKLVLAKEPLTNKELREQNIPYERILFNKDGIIKEHFNGFSVNSSYEVKIKPDNKKLFCSIVVLPFLLIVLLTMLYVIKFD